MSVETKCGQNPNHQLQNQIVDVFFSCAPYRLNSNRIQFEYLHFQIFHTLFTCTMSLTPVSQSLWEVLLEKGVWISLFFSCITFFLGCSVNSVYCVLHFFILCLSAFIFLCVGFYFFHPFCIFISPSSPPASSSPVCQRPSRPRTFALDHSTRPLKWR